jgi:HEAT repeat protein
MNPELSHLLYEDENGEVIGLGEVQLLDPPPRNRVEKLQQLLSDPSDWLAFQASLILAAWGEPEGVASLSKFVAQWPNRVIGFSHHRLRGYDNSYDEIADAAHLFQLSNGNSTIARDLFRGLLALYGPVEYESRLKYALLRSDCHDLIPDIIAAIDRARCLGKFYLASQLLPPLARLLGTGAVSVIDPFFRFNDDPNPRVNIAESFQYIEPGIAEPILKELEKDTDSIVSDQARSSLEMLRGKT